MIGGLVGGTGDAVGSRRLCPSDNSPVIGGKPNRLGFAMDSRSGGNLAGRAYPCVRFAPRPLSLGERGRHVLFAGADGFEVAGGVGVGEGFLESFADGV